MICADTNCWIAYLAGEQGGDVEILDRALGDTSLAMAPVVLAELLTDPAMPPRTETGLLAIELLETTPGYWQRAGKLRALLRQQGHEARLADTLIAQTCLDHRVPLLTRDRDFLVFVKHAGLVLIAF